MKVASTIVSCIYLALAGGFALYSFIPQAAVAGLLAALPFASTLAAIWLAYRRWLIQLAIGINGLVVLVLLAVLVTIVCNAIYSYGAHGIALLGSLGSEVLFGLLIAAPAALNSYVLLKLRRQTAARRL